MKDNLGTNGDEVAFSLVSQNDKHLLLIASFFCPAVQTHTKTRYSRDLYIVGRKTDSLYLGRTLSIADVYVCTSLPLVPPLFLSTPPPFYCPFAGASKGLFSLLFARGATLKKALFRWNHTSALRV